MQLCKLLLAHSFFSWPKYPCIKLCKRTPIKISLSSPSFYTHPTPTPRPAATIPSGATRPEGERFRKRAAVGRGREREGEGEWERDRERAAAEKERAEGDGRESGKKEGVNWEGREGYFGKKKGCLERDFGKRMDVERRETWEKLWLWH